VTTVIDEADLVLMGSVGPDLDPGLPLDPAAVLLDWQHLSDSVGDPLAGLAQRAWRDTTRLRGSMSR